jgi:hypothetical protein
LNVGPIFARTVRHFFPAFNDWLDQVPDPRRQDRVIYHRRFLLWYGVLLFVGKLSSRRQLDYKYREEGSYTLENINRLATTQQSTVPINDTLDDYLAKIGANPVAALRAQMVDRLNRMRVLDAARVQGRLVVGLDGTGYLTFRTRHCAHCLTRACGDHVSYSHQALEAKIFGPAETVLSLGTEFIDNQDLADSLPTDSEEKRKQDCELKASRRLLERIRKDFPQLKLCLSGDALYGCGAGFQLAKEFNTSFVFVFKEGRLPALWREFQALLASCPKQRWERGEDGWRHTYGWIDNLPYTDSDKRIWRLKAIHYIGYGPNGEVSEWAWLTSADLVVTAATVERLVWGAGRPRWRLENQGFNVQKNSGLNLEHAYSEGEHFGAYYLLIQVAHLLLQLLEKGSLLRQLAREAGKRCVVALLGSLKNIAAFLVESLRNWIWPEGVFGAQEGIQIRLDSS